MKTLRAVIAFAYIFIGIIYSYFIWYKLDFSSIDLSGHIASAAQFARSGLHSFNDRMFLGTTHNLFYPPLEDITINIIKLISFQNNLISFQIYLILLMLGYIAILYSLGKNFQNKIAYSFYHLSIIALLTINKIGTHYLQGMSFSDLVRTGLTNQFLSGIAFFWICKEIIKPSKNSERNITLAAIASVLSHIIVGAVSLALLFLYSLPSIEKNKEKKIKIAPLALTLGICSFYLIPFFYYKSYLTSSNIFVGQPWIPFLLALIALGMSYKSLTSAIFFSLSCVLFTTVTFFPAMEILSTNVPSFHYYRFTIIAYYLFVIGLAHFINSEKYSKIGSIILSILALIFYGYIYYIFDITKDFFSSPDFIQNETHTNIQEDPNSNFGRYLLISNERSAGTSIESLMTLNSSHNRFTKGLFWESSYTNLLESSFTATLLKPPVVLDFFYYYGYSCEMRSCLMDEHFRLYNIQGLVANFDQLGYLKNQTVNCFKGMIANGTEKYKFIPQDSFKYDKKNYNIYQLESKKKTNPSELSAVELISPKKIKVASSNLLKNAENIIIERFRYCEKPKDDKKDFSVYLMAREEEKFIQLNKAFQSNDSEILNNKNIILKKISDHEYSFTLPKVNSWYTLKLSPQPGMVIINQKGEEAATLRGFPYTIGVGSGEMRVIFKRTNVMWASYLISAISLLIFFIRFKRKNSNEN